MVYHANGASIRFFLTDKNTMSCRKKLVKFRFIAVTKHELCKIQMAYLLWPFRPEKCPI